MFEREINEPSGCGGDNPDVMSHPDLPLFPIFSTDEHRVYLNWSHIYSELSQ